MDAALREFVRQAWLLVMNDPERVRIRAIGSAAED